MNIPAIAAAAVLKAWGKVDTVLTTVTFRDVPTPVYTAATDTTATTWGITLSTPKALLYGEKDEEEDKGPDGIVAGKVKMALFQAVDLNNVKPTTEGEVLEGSIVWKITAVDAPPGDAIFILSLRHD